MAFGEAGGYLAECGIKLAEVVDGWLATIMFLKCHIAPSLLLVQHEDAKLQEPSMTSRLMRIFALYLLLQVGVHVVLYLTVHGYKMGG